LSCPLSAKLEFEFLTISPAKPWNAALLFEIPIGGLNDKLFDALYYL